MNGGDGASLGPLLTIRSRDLRLGIWPERGAMAVSLVHRPTGTEVLRRPADAAALDAAPFTHGIPILFPAGRIKGAACTVEGHVFRWPVNDSLGPNHLHGFLWKVPWRVTHREEHRADLEPTAKGRDAASAGFGAEIDAHLSYRLDANQMESQLTIRNRSARVIPFGAGYHTSLALTRPWMLALPPGREWEMDQESLPTGRLLDRPHSLGPIAEGVRVRELVSDTCYRPDDGGPNVARLWDPQSGLSVEMHAPAPFRQWVVYRPSLDADFVSVEPVTWVHNAANLDLPSRLTGMAVLRPDESATLVYRWVVTQF
jgi:aldose 1-epimerase